MFNWIRNLIARWKYQRQLAKRIKEMRQRDPFIYK